MKLRYITIIFTLMILILIAVIYGQAKDNAYSSIDVIRLNENYKSVVNGLQNGENVNKLEKSYGCEILLKTDKDYESRVMAAVKSSRILMDYEAEGRLLGKIVFSGEGDLFDSLRSALMSRMIQICILILLSGYITIGLIYYYYVLPFKKMQLFAANVAKGELDAPLYMTKRNYFGAFTESFDLMREELKSAKENEYKANVSKKELVAELSHDMKTPIATIKAACEVLKAKVKIQGNAEESSDILEKVGVIEQKSDMINQLINNMFHAALEELTNLKVEPKEEPSTKVSDMINELKYYGAVNIKTPVPECLVYMDTLRLKQVIDNVVNNSYKYAGTQIDVSFKEQIEGIVVEIRDFGAGVPEEELPLVTGKFFRGKNSKGKSGAGLGLFLVKYFMDNMKGAFECFNDKGFVVNLFLRKV